MIAQGENAPRRLRVQLIPIINTRQSQADAPLKSQIQNVKILQRQKVTLNTPEQKPMFQDESQEDKGNGEITRAIPHAEYPDTYDILVNGVKKGYAAVQDIKLSRVLREAVKDSDKSGIPVNIEWSSEFSMYEITSLAL
jgi:hypothetical protein